LPKRFGAEGQSSLLTVVLDRTALLAAIVECKTKTCTLTL